MPLTERKKRPFGLYLMVSLVLHAIRTGEATNIDCAGKAFYCSNSTNFMICVDQGNGIALTVDDMSIPCPPGTECRPDNIFECEFPRLTTPPMRATVTSDAIENSTSATVVSVSTATQDKNTIAINNLGSVITDSPINAESVSTSFDSKLTPKEESAMNISERKISTEKELLFTTPLTQVLTNSSYNTEGLFVTTNYENTLITQEVTMNTLSDFTVNPKANTVNVNVSTVSHPQDNVKKNALDYSTNSPITIDGQFKNVDFTGIARDLTAADTFKSELSSQRDPVSTTPLIKTLINSSQNTEGLNTVSLNYNDTSITQEITMNTLADTTTEIKNATNRSIGTVEQPRGTTENITLDRITTNSPIISTPSKSTYYNFTVSPMTVTIANATEKEVNSKQPYSNNNTEGISTTETISVGIQFGNISEKNTLDYITTKLINITTSTSTPLDSMVIPREEIVRDKTETGFNLEKDLLFTTPSIQEPIHSNNNSEGISTINITTADIQFGNTSEKRTLDYTTTSPPIMTETKSTYLNSTVTLSGKITANITEARLNSEQDMPLLHLQCENQ
ncbi:hypothetical protein EVAR_33974_1 [Eumeta japonica]|uniref:Chitin-binding type-2 domain-containing protein n=1 Tax=Eumeta variegata TaxID=151549 RepID=A0A4C1WZK6_EUMVA|nr:hypothetical protein EVAR_33974_1 [Eumeta japonica]